MGPTSATPGTSRAKQTLLALVILGGVLLMHGVAADHAMPMSHGPTSGTHGSMAAVQAIGHESSDLLGDAEQQPASAVWSSPEAGSHAMVAGCVAVLVTGLMLPLVLAGRRLRVRTRPFGLNRLPALRPGNNATASLWLLTPSLTRLGIART